MQLQWSEQLATGFPQIDDEHKVLIAELNKLGAVLAANSIDIPEAQRFMTFLGTYTARHFAHEERCMNEARCPVAAANKTAHANFIRLFVEAKLKIGAGTDIVELRKLHSALCEWVVAHILKIDTNLRTCRPRSVSDPHAARA